MLYFLYFLEEVVHSLISIYPPYLSGHSLEFIIEHEEKYGGIIKYTVYQDLEDESKSAKKGGGAAVGTRPIDIYCLDLWVGHIVSVEKVLPVSSYNLYIKYNIMLWVESLSIAELKYKDSADDSFLSPQSKFVYINAFWHDNS